MFQSIEKTRLYRGYLHTSEVDEIYGFSKHAEFSATPYGDIGLLYDDTLGGNRQPSFNNVLNDIREIIDDSKITSVFVRKIGTEGQWLRKEGGEAPGELALVPIGDFEEATIVVKGGSYDVAPGDIIVLKPGAGYSVLPVFGEKMFLMTFHSVRRMENRLLK